MSNAYRLVVLVLFASIVLMVSPLAVGAMLDFSRCERFVQPICAPFSNKMVSCQGSGYVCPGAFPGLYEYYCELGDASFVVCDGGCEDGLCVNKDGIPERVTCTEGSQHCGLGVTMDRHGDIYECRNNAWTFKLDCNSLECVEYNSLGVMKARCDPNWRYCIDSNAIDCYKKASDGANCYGTESECLWNIPVYCLSSDRTKCTVRKGSCLANEYRNTGAGAREQCGERVDEERSWWDRLTNGDGSDTNYSGAYGCKGLTFWNIIILIILLIAASFLFPKWRKWFILAIIGLLLVHFFLGGLNTCNTMISLLVPW